MIEQERTFYVDGVPVSWYEIYDWWQKLRERNRKEADSIGDPYWNEKTCWIIANKIVQEIEIKIHGKISNHFKGADDTVTQKDTYVVKLRDEVDVDWRDQNAVFKKALEDSEKKYKEKIRLEEERRKQEVYEKWRHEQAAKKSQEKTYQPPPEPPKPKELLWRDLLGIPYGLKVDEEMIKTYFRRTAMICHPDKGGTNDKMEELFRARDAAYRAIGLNPP